MKQRYLMHMSVDMSTIIPYRYFTFVYKNKTFRLKNDFSNLHTDCLSAIINDTDQDRKLALQLARNWGMGLSHSNNGSCNIEYCGGTYADAVTPIHKYRSSSHELRSGPLWRRVDPVHELYGITDIETEDQSRGMYIYNLARRSTDRYAAFHFFWQVLEVVKQKGNTSQWIDGVPAKVLEGVNDCISRIPLGGMTLGNYLYEEGRNAIAHLRRYNTNFSSIDFNSIQDVNKIANGVEIVRELAEHYLKSVLKIEKKLFLYKIPRRPYYIYLNEIDAIDLGAKPPIGLRRTKATDRMINEMQRGLNCGFMAKRDRQMHKRYFR